jgi:N,N'-diacetyllegionaminate synthase
MKIENKVIGPGHPAFIIAEVAQAHDGSLGTAHAYIDAAADAGVDAIKFQTHIASAESTKDEPFRIKFSQQDDTRYAYWKRMEFSFEQWQGLAEHALEKGLVFLSSPFSVAAVELLEKLGMPAWKFGSGETVSGDIFEAVLATGKPLLVSSGMSSFAELDELAEMFTTSNRDYAFFQCTSKYPVDFEEVGLNVIDEMKARYGCPVGLSDHSGSVYPALAAMTRGADLLEAHIVFDKSMYGPDTPASLTVNDFKTLVEARNVFHILNSHPVDKDEMAESMQTMRGLFGKSLALIESQAKGTVLTEDMLTAKKPGSGIPLDMKADLCGRVLNGDVPGDRLLQWEDLA